MSAIACFRQLGIADVPRIVYSMLPKAGPSSSNSTVFDAVSSTSVFTIAVAGYAISATFFPLSLTWAVRIG